MGFFAYLGRNFFTIHDLNTIMDNEKCKEGTITMKRNVKIDD